MPTDLATTLRECADAGRRLVIQLPDTRCVAIEPLAVDADPAAEDDDDDDFMNRLIENNAEFREYVARAQASGYVPLELDPDKYADLPPLAGEAQQRAFSPDSTVPKST